jgi:hypothetical protein
MVLSSGKHRRQIESVVGFRKCIGTRAEYLIGGYGDDNWIESVLLFGHCIRPTYESLLCDVLSRDGTVPPERPNWICRWDGSVCVHRRCADNGGRSFRS